MRLVVKLAGEPLAWRYKDADRLGNWIDDRPWTGPPVAEVIRLIAPAAADHTLAAVRDAVTAADRGATRVETFELDPAAAAAEGFAGAAAGFFGAASTRPLPELARALARNLIDRPVVWLVPPLPIDRPQILVETEGFLDLLAKLAPGARTVVVFTDTPRSPLTGRCFDLTTGGPVVSSDLLTAPDARVWPQYLHRRLAWESGGHLPRAEQLAAAVTAARLRLGDDEELERLLNAEAAASFGRLSHAERALAEAGVEVCVTRGGAGLAGSELFWPPWHLSGTAPVPWVARALVARNPSRPFADFIRGSMLCLPTAQELLSACLLIENHIRGRVRLPPAPPDTASCHTLWTRFQDGTAFGIALYPDNCPSSPTGPWAFASLGEILANEIGRPPGPDWRHDVRELRNHLAHGHHVGWEAVRLARRLLSRIAHG